ncbi:MAG TPA: PilZ domain-containing protein, partial [Thermodesulfobacteriota bacterium]|nr:PilZ domain-containing protein [Thermodesulfobacteriota bacterium]
MTVKKATTKETTKKKTTQKKNNASPPKVCCSRGAKSTAAKAAPKATAKKPAAPVQEKRRYLRLHYSRLISFIQYDTNNQIEIPAGMAAVKNLSEAGILIEAANVLKPGDPIDLDIAFEQEKIIPTRGEVVYTKKVNRTRLNAGIKFTKIK